LINRVTVALGPQPVTGSFTEDAYCKAVTNSQEALVCTYVASGSFVLGDKTTARALGSDTPLAWWGAQWAKLNDLTYCPAPSAFKALPTPSRRRG
jgi:hypothetical protein